MNASSRLRDLYLRERSGLDGNVIRYSEICSRPRVGVGVSGSSRFPFLLILPIGAVSEHFTSETIEALPFEQKYIEPIDSGESETITTSIVSFRNLSRAAEIFIDAIVSSALETDNMMEVSELVSEFIELFSKKTTLTMEEVVGFFGEMLVVEMCNATDSVLESWHSNPNDRYDFALGSDRLEVKTTMSPRRVHRFSSTQLPAPKGVSVDFASIITQQVPYGSSIFDLYGIVRAKTELTGRRRLDLLFSRFASRDEATCEELMFDLNMARESLKIFNAEDVPRPLMTPRVISAKWQSDLTDTPAGLPQNALSKMIIRGNGI